MHIPQPLTVCFVEIWLFPSRRCWINLDHRTRLFHQQLHFFFRQEQSTAETTTCQSPSTAYTLKTIDIQTASLTWTYYAWHNLRLALQNSTIIADSYTIFPGTFGLYTLFVFNLCFTLFRYSLCFALHSRLLDYFALGFLPSISCKWLAFCIPVLHLFLSCISPRCFIASFVLIATTQKRKHLIIMYFVYACI